MVFWNNNMCEYCFCALEYCIKIDVRSAGLEFDVHSVFAISRPIYEIQKNSIYSFNIQILANLYVHTPSKFVSHEIYLQGVKFLLLMLIYELVFNKKKTVWNSDCYFHLHLKSI